MKDNELYTYFKERENSYNEMPGNELWEKIEHNLNNKSGITVKPANLFIKIAATLLIAGISGIIILNTLINKEIDVQERKENFESLPSTPSAKTLETNETLKPTYADTVKTKKRVLKSNKDTLTNKTEKQKSNYLKFKPIVINTDTTQKVVLQAKLPEFKTQVMQGRVLVTGKGRFGKQDFDLLTQHALESHKTAYGSMIIVKAAGHQTFRHKVPDRDHYMIMSDSLTGVPVDSLIIKYKNGKPLPPSEQRRNKRKETNKPNDSVNNNISYVRFLTQSDSLKSEDSKLKPQDSEIKGPKTEFDK